MARKDSTAAGGGAKAAAPKPGRLKVFRTAIGFHDAYVAAPSRKAALAAWGTDKDLFARGAADVVTDPELTAEPLAAPGTVIRRTRGSLAEQLRAAGDAKPAGGSKRAKPAGKPQPPPSRKPVEAAEAALAAFEQRAGEEADALRAQEAELRRRREALEAENRARAAELEQRLQEARESYETALQKWREAG